MKSYTFFNRLMLIIFSYLPKSASLENVEILLPPAETLLTQFAHRLVFTICEADDDRLSLGYWLSVPTSDEADQDVEQVRNVKKKNVNFESMLCSAPLI